MGVSELIPAVFFGEVEITAVDCSSLLPAFVAQSVLQRVRCSLPLGVGKHGLCSCRKLSYLNI